MVAAAFYSVSCGKWNETPDLQVCRAMERDVERGTLYL